MNKYMGILALLSVIVPVIAAVLFWSVKMIGKRKKRKNEEATKKEIEERECLEILDETIIKLYDNTLDEKYYIKGIQVKLAHNRIYLESLDKTLDEKIKVCKKILEAKEKGEKSFEIRFYDKEGST